MKFVSLISSGIDSPVATYLFSNIAKGIILVHTDNRPFTDDREITNFIEISVHLKKKMKSDIKVYIVPHKESLNSFRQNCNNRFTCVFCKRMMLRYAQEIAKKEKAEAIIMGDSLGQVASQTLQNIRVVDQAVEFPILRPIIGYDKEQIVNIAKEIGTYDLSIRKSDGCSAVPKKPSTRTQIDTILAEEDKIDITKLVKNVIGNSNLIDI